jgi:hypothetical protein
VGSGNFVGSGVAVGGEGLLVDVGGIGVLLGRGVRVGAVSVGFFVGMGVQVDVGGGVSVGFFVGMGVDVNVGGGGGSKRLVLVGPMGLRVGEAVGVCDAVGVREWVMVKMGLTVGGDVKVAVGEFVAVKKSLANSARVMTISVLTVGVDNLPPVFGMRRSGSCRFCLADPLKENGRTNPSTQAVMITRNTIYSCAFTTTALLFNTF